MVRLNCWFLVIVVLKDVARPERAACEHSWRGADKEGVIGSVHAFPWLGVLRVHLHQETSFKIALTGIVLVKENYAIGNADDIARIPKRVFQEDSRAMFIPADRTPWYCRPIDYMTHPEFELDTLSSLALIELAPPPDVRTFPMKPVCRPPPSYNTSVDLYAVGFTDENQVLEKFVYKLQHVDRGICREFYNRAGLTEGKMAPLNYECGFAMNNKDSCVWDNGMALISNSSGRWMLIGFGVQGPGCAAPARFLTLAHYYPWIESATNIQEIPDQGNYRKSAFRKGFKKPEVEYIPVHELLRSNASTRKQSGGHVKHDFAHYYPQDSLIDYVRSYDDHFKIDRVSGTEIQINLSKNGQYRLGRYGDCSDKNISLIYNDFVNVSVSPVTNYRPPNKGVIKYKVSLHDSLFTNYTCITIKLHTLKANNAYLYYDTKMDDTTIIAENPDEIIREYPFYTLTSLVNKTKTDHLVPAPISTDGKNITAYNVNLFIKAIFQGDARLEFRFHGPLKEIKPIITTPKTVTTTVQSSTTKDPYANLRKNVPLEQEQLEKDVDNFNDVVESSFNHASFRTDALYMLLVIVSMYHVLL